MTQSGESLRDRKKRRTRAALERATLRLAAEKGFDHVTVEEIAAEVDVSVRTFFNYFASKDDAILGTDPEVGPRVAARILAAPETTTPFDALKEAVLVEIDDEMNGQRDLWLLRKDVFMQRPDLLLRAFSSNEATEKHLVAALAQRAGVPEADTRPRLMVVAGTAAFRCAIAHWAQDDSTSLKALIVEAYDLLGTGLNHVPNGRGGEA